MTSDQLPAIIRPGAVAASDEIHLVPSLIAPAIGRQASSGRSDPDAVSVRLASIHPAAKDRSFFQMALPEQSGQDIARGSRLPLTYFA